MSRVALASGWSWALVPWALTIRWLCARLHPLISIDPRSKSLYSPPSCARMHDASYHFSIPARDRKGRFICPRLLNTTKLMKIIADNRVSKLFSQDLRDYRGEHLISPGRVSIPEDQEYRKIHKLKELCYMYTHDHGNCREAINSRYIVCYIPNPASHISKMLLWHRTLWIDQSPRGLILLLWCDSSRSWRSSTTTCRPPWLFD